MNECLKKIILFLMNKKYVGGKHFPENKLITSRTKYHGSEEVREFEKEYKEFVNNLFLLKLKKKTGKGSEFHISINPRKIKEIFEELNKRWKRNRK